MTVAVPADFAFCSAVSSTGNDVTARTTTNNVTAAMWTESLSADNVTYNTSSTFNPHYTKLQLNRLQHTQNALARAVVAAPRSSSHDHILRYLHRVLKSFFQSFSPDQSISCLLLSSSPAIWPVGVWQSLQAVSVGVWVRQFKPGRLILGALVILT